ncbi:OmpA family protein [Aquimarina sp. 2201CG5-10]|uniref:OmpA family protein n=1 Tax=Aquimarina callyspongiae TaxID=3098150 RepID=UPI002AB48650|nr:OmpA family protein [Aquimarina sp. 2201CG5-10]MDY8136109.1 OmpA family protein [Aquimarina sp. 2201CG5-10]
MISSHNNKKVLKVFVLLLIIVQLIGCKAMKNAEIGGIIGAAGGAVIGGVIGNNVGDGDTELGAVIGGIVGATVGGLIGNKMDEQAKKITEEMPSVVVERVEETINIVFDENSGVYFDTNAYELNDSSKETIQRLANILKEYPNSDILVEGHTDNVGSEESNYMLSKNRAGSVTDYIVSQEVSPLRFTVKWYGELQPKYTNETPEGRLKNRRVEITISPNDTMREEALQQSKG